MSKKIIIPTITVLILFVAILLVNKSSKKEISNNDMQADYCEFVGKENICEIEEINGFGDYYYSELSKVIVTGVYVGDLDSVNGILVAESNDNSKTIEAFGNSNIDTTDINEVQEVYVRGEMTVYKDEGGEENYGIFFDTESDGVFTEIDDSENVLDISDYIDLCTNIYQKTSFITTGTLIRKNQMYYLRQNESDAFQDYIRLIFKDEEAVAEYIDHEITVNGTYYPFEDLDGLRNVEIINE